MAEKVKEDLNSGQATIVLQNGLSLLECISFGSTFEINTFFKGYYEQDTDDPEFVTGQCVDTLGAPVESFELLEQGMEIVDADGYVRKKVLEEGGGQPLHEGCTVEFIYSAYFEKQNDPIDYLPARKPLQVDLKDNNLLLGLNIAIRTMLVGEISLFSLSHQVMYGVVGVPPKIKPKAKWAYYIKIIRSFLTPAHGLINYSQKNIFQIVHKEVRHLYMMGVQFHTVKNYGAAIQCFKKAVDMLNKCRLANEDEETTQEKLLHKLFLNLAICYNKSQQPLRACTACNEINRLSNIWNNSKALFQNAKALRMIGEFNQAKKKLKRAIVLCPDSEEMKQEEELLNKTWKSYNKSKIIGKKLTGTGNDSISEEFKSEVDTLLEKFKSDFNIVTLTIPAELNSLEIQYIKKVCERQKLYWTNVASEIAFDKVKKSGSSSKIDD